MALALPAAAQVPTPTATATVPAPSPTATVPGPTATPTPPIPTASVGFDSPTLAVGDPVTASGSAANGDYCLSMVPAGVFTLGNTYAGTPVSSVDLSITSGSFSAVTVNSSAPAGQFDILLLAGTCASNGVIVAGEFLDDRNGLDVGAASANPIPTLSLLGTGMLLALLAVAGAILIWRRA